MSPELVVGLLSLVAVYAVLSHALEVRLITLPMVFTAAGLLVGLAGAEILPMHGERQTVHLVAEVTLVLVLFSDASRISLRALSGGFVIPLRMLLIGMPLTVLFGTLIAKWVSPDQSWALALLVAAILTPTDAALSQPVVTSDTVPGPIGRGINVESGLNDGLALPLVLVAATLAAGAGTLDAAQQPGGLAAFALKQIMLGPLVGVAIGLGAARLLDVAIRAGTLTEVYQGIFFLSIAFIAYFGAELVGGNGFIAAFTGGLAFGNSLRASARFIEEFMEGEGQLLTMLTFLIFGAVLAPLGFQHASLKTVALAVLFLTVVRMLPIWLSLAGSGLSSYEKLFLGWFGPRGLASILFVLYVLERFAVPGRDELIACVVLTVLISIVAHGLTAGPLAARFAARPGAGRAEPAEKIPGNHRPPGI